MVYFTIKPALPQEYFKKVFRFYKQLTLFGFHPLSRLGKILIGSPDCITCGLYFCRQSPYNRNTYAGVIHSGHPTATA